MRNAVSCMESARCQTLPPPPQVGPQIGIRNSKYKSTGAVSHQPFVSPPSGTRLGRLNRHLGVDCQLPGGRPEISHRGGAAYLFRSQKRGASAHRIRRQAPSHPSRLRTESQCPNLRRSGVRNPPSSWAAPARSRLLRSAHSHFPPG